jgi:diguanylate cyclase (GGDEF)-like protein
VRHLADLIPRVQSGELPIDALSQIAPRLRGDLGPLLAVFQDLLHDLRRQRAEKAQLEQEMGQRVARRTDALERALGSMKQQAVRDPLTGLYNRRMLDQHLPQMVERRWAERGDLSILMIDVDNFKLLNDTLGHAAGDDLLRSIGQLIRSSIRDSDLAFRCGGDEFVVLCDGCDLPAARKLADRLTALVDALAKPLKVKRPPRLSIGVSRLADLSNPSAHALLQEADRHLYEVKGARKRSA